MITTDTSDGGMHSTISASGELNIEEATALRDALVQALERSASVTVDLSGAEELDLACMQVLLAAKTGLPGCGGGLCINGLSARLARAVEEAGLPRLTTA